MVAQPAKTKYRCYYFSYILNFCLFDVVTSQRWLFHLLTFSVGRSSSGFHIANTSRVWSYIQAERYFWPPHIDHKFGFDQETFWWLQSFVFNLASLVQMKKLSFELNALTGS